MNRCATVEGVGGMAVPEPVCTRVTPLLPYLGQGYLAKSRVHEIIATRVTPTCASRSHPLI